MNGLLRPPRGGVRRELSSSYSGSRLPALGAGSPVRFVVRGKFGPGRLRRHLPPDVGLRPVRTQEAAELSSGWWKAHLQAPAKTNSHKTVVVFHHCAVGTGNDFVKIWLVLRLSKILQFFGSGWGLTSAPHCTLWLPSSAAGMSRQALQIRANILYVYADQYIAVSAHSEGWRVEPAGICPLPYRQPGTMSREGTKRPLASPCNASSAMQRGGEPRLLHRVTLFHPPRATCSFRWGGAPI